MRHLHKCQCGAVLICSQPLDQCPIRHFDCPVCEDRAIDAYFSRLANEQEPQPEPTAQETRHEKH